MAAASRIRVLIAGNVYVKRALVRRFLEDDGYEVVGEVLTAEAVLPAIRAGRPDALVLDEDLTGGAPIPAIRAAAPDVRVVVFTAASPGSSPPPLGADAYLDKGVGLSALTALLGRLFAAETAPLEPLPVSAGAATAVTAAGTDLDPTEASMADTQQLDPAPARKSGPSGSMAYRLVAIIAGGLLIAWGVIAAIQGEDSGGATQTVAEGGTVGTGDDILAGEPVSELDEAYASLDTMISALEGGNYVLATIEAQSLMDLRERALAAGFAVTGFDAEVTARLGAIVPDLPTRVSSQLADILGGLFPALPEEAKPGGGSGVVLGTTVTNGGGGTTGDGDTGGDTGGGGGGGDQEPAPKAGDGKVWGQWHKENKGDGGPPPWANGHK